MRVDATVSEATESALRRLSSLASGSVSQQMVIPTALAIAEARVDEMIDELVVAHQTTASTFGHFVVDKAKSSFHQNWKGRHDVLTKGFGIVISSTVRQDFEGVIDVRNAVAHGDGLLTAFQTANWASAIAIRRRAEETMDVKFAGRRLMVGNDTTRNVVNLVRLYLLDLDVAVGRQLGA